MINRRRLISVVAATAMTIGMAACGDTANSDGVVSVRLGYFANLTHAPALVGIRNGHFAAALGSEARLTTATFNAGPLAIESLFSGAIDATFIGPNPAINAYLKSHGKAIRIVAGATSGGAALVVRQDINSAEDLRGTTLASPQLGGTQDVALRSWLADNKLTTDASGGGDVAIVPQANAATLDAFKAGDITGAWLPEPWATRLVLEGNGKVLVDEADLWPEGKFVTTQLIVSTEFLKNHPQQVCQLIEGELAALDEIANDPAKAQAAANDQIEAVTGKRLPDDLIAASWPSMTFTYDPVASSLRTSADHATAVGLLDTVDLTGIYDLTILNQVLADRKLAPVKGL